MIWSDSIVDEVRRARDAYAARFNYNLRAIFRDLKEQEQRSGRRIVPCPEDDLQFEPNQALQPTEAATSVLEIPRLPRRHRRLSFSVF